LSFNASTPDGSCEFVHEQLEQRAIFVITNSIG